MNNVNFDFLLDIWAEIKAKRLAPVAIGLVVALVAMPALLLKGEGDASEAPLPVLAPASSNGAKVEVDEELAARGSKLDSYGSHDPFKGKIKPAAAPGTGTGTATAPSDLLGGSKSDKGTDLPSLGSGGSPITSGSTGSSGSGSAGGQPTPPPTIMKPRQSRYNYQLDVKFGRPGREKLYRGVTRMTFLPKPTVPILLFMGVPVSERSAIFFVYPGLTHQGEGKCVPSPKECNFLELEVGKQHYLSANDLEFRIELLKIRRVKLSDEKKADQRARKVSGRRSNRTTDADEVGVQGSTGDFSDREYDFPWLVDGIG